MIEHPERRFVVDSMLGKVAKWLRVLGFDTLYERLRFQDQIDGYVNEGFLLITRNQRWCGQGRVYCLKANDPGTQLIEVIEGVPISFDEVRPLQRCIRCNQPLEILPHEQAHAYVPEYVFETNREFYQCPNCRRVYWPGTHSRRMMEQLRRTVGWPIQINSE